MTNPQLYLALGVPLVLWLVNMSMFLWLSSRLEKRIERLEDKMDRLEDKIDHKLQLLQDDMKRFFELFADHRSRIEALEKGSK